VSGLATVMRRAPRTAVLAPLAVLVVLGLSVSSCAVAGDRPIASPSEAGVAAPPASGARLAVAPGFSPAPGVTETGAVAENVSLTVDVGLASRDPSGLTAFVDATTVPGTPWYHGFLSASSAAGRFGASPGAIASAESYFRAFGLTTATHQDGLLLSVSGSGPAVARAFGTTLDVYRAPSGATFVDHPTDASLPPVAPWTGVIGLDTAPSFRPDVRETVSPSGVGPTATCASSTSGLSPCDVATAYGFPWLSSGGANGSGKRIAVVDAYSSGETQTDLASDYAQFDSQEALPSGGLSFLYPVPTSANLNASGVNPGWALEDALDVEWVHAAAPGAAVEMVFSPNAGPGLYFAIDWLVSARATDVLSMSWGEPEVGIYNAVKTPCSSACNASSDGSFAILDPVLELAAAEGISTFAASGDCGAADGTSGVAVNFPASDPFVTGVGATNLSVGSGGAYQGETAWGGNASGGQGSGCNNQGGSGGGFSILPHPWWQTGLGTVPAAGRGVPDVAIVGGSSSPVVVVSGGGDLGLAGTSVATPIWAGVAATADQVHGSDLGWLDPGLYRILGGSTYTTEFHEIVSGSNGYPAGPGWNPVTGIGTPFVGRLLANLTAGPTAPSSLAAYAFASPRFGAAPLNVRFTVGVHGGSGTYPLEGVAFGDGNASTLVAGAANETFSSPGVYPVQAYVVDSADNVSVSPPVVVVVGGGGPLTVQLNATGTTLPVGTNDTFTASASGASGPFLYNFSFGDGAFSDNLTSGTVTHRYNVPGAFCAEAVVRTSGLRPAGGASLRVPVAVGGATSSTCGNPAAPLSLVVNASEGVRDAPADFPSLFTTTGGSVAPGGLAPQIGLVTVAPANAYTAACECTIFRTPGTYTVREWENDTVGGEATATTNVTVGPALNATFQASTLTGPAPLAVAFSATATGGDGASASATHWAFGNGLAATGATATATYTTPGEYLALASLSDRGHGNASEAFLIDATASGPPSAGLTATVTPAVNVSSGTTVHWNATAVGPASSTAGDVIAWNFGNGESAFGPVANETYFASVDLLAGNELVGAVALETPYLDAVVRVPVTLPGFFATEGGGFVPAVDDLVLTGQVYPSSGAVPLLVTGTASGSGPSALGLSWLFGDGGSASGPTVAHDYYGAGEFTVRVEGYDRQGDVAFRLASVVANAALSLSGCGARTREGMAPYTVQFSPTPVGGAGPPYTYLWTLPDGTTLSETNLTVAFSAAGTYTVSLVVTDAAKAIAACVWSVVVTVLPAVSFLDVVLGGTGAGVALAVVFLWATRPRPPRAPALAGGPSTAAPSALDDAQRAEARDAPAEAGPLGDPDDLVDVLVRPRRLLGDPFPGR